MKTQPPHSPTSAELAERIEISRRELLALVGASAATAIASAILTPAAHAQANGVHTLPFGDSELTVLSDGGLVLPVSRLAPAGQKAKLDEILVRYGLPMDVTRSSCNVPVFKSGERVVIFDTGAGPNFQQTAGKLPASLETAGIDPESVTDIVLTHAHPDHLWGILDDFDEPTFANARVLVPRQEWDFWRADDALAAMPEGFESFVVGAQNRFSAIEDRVEFIDAGSEPLPGVMPLDSSGHTPGHMSFHLTSGSDQIIVAGDAITHPAVSFEMPSWASGADMDADMASATRRRLLDQLAAEKLLLLGFHLPFPGLGNVEAKDTAYRFVAS